MLQVIRSRQGRRMSFIEAIIGTIVGFLVTLIAQLIIFPAYGVHTSLETNLRIVGWFTLLSIVRGYVMRRFFEWVHMRYELLLFKRQRKKDMAEVIKTWDIAESDYEGNCQCDYHRSND